MVLRRGGMREYDVIIDAWPHYSSSIVVPSFLVSNFFPILGIYISIIIHLGTRDRYQLPGDKMLKSCNYRSRV